MMIKYALIMAGGRGVRLMPLTKDLAKPLVKFKDSLLISNALDQLIDEIESVSLTVGYLGGELARFALEKGVNNIFNTNGKDNCWWLFNTPMKYIDAPVLVLTCDNIVELDFKWIIAEYKKLLNPLCMLVPVKPVTGVDGDYILEENFIVKYLSRQLVTETYASGIQVLNPKKINDFIKSSNSFDQLWTALIQKRQLKCSATYIHKWYSINTVEQLRIAENNYVNK